MNDIYIISIIELILLIVAILFLLGIYSSIYVVKLHLYLKKTNRLDHVSLPWDKNVDPISGTIKNWRYFLGNMNEEDVIIKDYKSKLRNAGKLGWVLIGSILILFALIVLLARS